MKIHDISKGLLSSPVYPGDPMPELRQLRQMAFGDEYNLSELTMCVHSGTHLDAPLHFLPDGADVTALPLADVIGECTVVELDGPILGADAEELLPRIRDGRLLIKGDAWLTPSAAFVLSELKLIGSELASVAPPEVVASVHRQLLGEGTLLLENLDLSAVPAGTYFLVAAPIKIEGAEGAPVRAFLFEKETW
ncbi:MAG: cyclase family protein [Clostridia bacterium]|nr:cyclase family protein [Clostridia bacterium]